MGSSLQDMRKIVNFMRKNGVLAFRNADFELRITKDVLKLRKPRLKREMPTAQEKVQELSGDDLLFWSSTPAGMGE